MPAQGASVQQHLVEQSLLVGVGEKSCIARHSAKESRRLVVDKALEGVFAQEIIDRRRYDCPTWQTIQRMIAGMRQAHGTIKCALKKFIHRHTRTCLH